MAHSDHGAPLGAYGFRFLFGEADGTPDGVGRYPLVRVGPAAPAVRIRTLQASFVLDRQGASADTVVVGHRKGAGFLARREPARVDLFFPSPPPRDAVIHPVLTVPISVLSRWSGAITLHAGAFQAHGGAWAVLGAREAGKSTTLAAMAKYGCPVLADDLLVIDGTHVRSGPHCVDLRPDVAEHFAGADHIIESGGRARHRLTSGDGAAFAPLRGFLELRWHDSTAVRIEPLGRRELLRLLYGQEYIGLLGPADPRHILELLAIPAWRVSRPRDWETTDELCRRLLTLANERATSAQSMD